MGLTEFHTFSYFAMSLWAVILLCTVIAVFVCFENRTKGIVASLLALAAYALSCLMVLSATMYESGCRVTYHSSLVLVVLLLMLIAEIKENEKLQALVAGTALTLGMYQYASFAQALSQGFVTHIPW